MIGFFLIWPLRERHRVTSEKKSACIDIVRKSRLDQDAKTVSLPNYQLSNLIKNITIIQNSINEVKLIWVLFK